MRYTLNLKKKNRIRKAYVIAKQIDLTGYSDSKLRNENQFPDCGVPTLQRL